MLIDRRPPLEGFDKLNRWPLLLCCAMFRHSTRPAGMISNIFRLRSTRQWTALKRPIARSQCVRSLATAQEVTPRQMPVSRVRSTPVSHDRATFTIRVSHLGPLGIGLLLTNSGWPNLQRQILWRQIQHIRRSRLYNLACWLPRIVDGSVISWPDLGLHAAFDRQLWCSILDP